MKTTYSPKPLSMEFVEAFNTAKLFPTKQEVCHRNAKRGVTFNPNEVTGTQEEAVQALGYDLLASIHAELHDHPQMVATRKEEARLAAVNAEKVRDEGLTTEINTNSEHVNIRDTVENCVAIIARHPFGYRDNWTDEENKEAEQGMALALAGK